MPRQRRAAAIGEQGKAIVEAGCDLLKPKRGGARGRKLDGERDAVETPADGGDRRKILSLRQEACIQRRRPSDEKLHGAASQESVRRLLLPRRHVERRHAVDMFTLDPQHLAARRQNRRVGTESRDRFRQFGRRVDDVLAIVENQEEFLPADGPGHGFGRNLAPAQLQAKDAGNRGGDQAGVQRHQFDQPDVAVKIRDQAAGSLQRQRGLADPSRSGQRDRTISGEQIAQLLQRRRSANQGGA